MGKDTDEEGGGAGPPAKRARTSTSVIRLAFPDLSPTGRREEAADAITAAAQSFLESHAELNIELLLVVDKDAEHDGTALSARVADSRFLIHRSSLTSLADDGSLSQAIVTTCDERFRKTGSCWSDAVHGAAGAQLSSTALLLHRKAEAGKAYPVKLTPQSPLRAASQGVQFVILTRDLMAEKVAPELWEERLQSMYHTIFNTFAADVMPFVHTAEQASSSSATSAPVSPPAAAKVSAIGAAAAPTSTAAASKPDAASAGPSSHSATGFVVPPYRHPSQPPPRVPGSWQAGLQVYLDRPAQHREFIFMQHDNFIVIYDGYRKARVHLLIIPRPPYIRANGISDLRAHHLDNLAAMHEAARQIAERVNEQHGGDLDIRLGYHAIPSMVPLHLHIISQDFDSPALKTKKHWNTFTTAFFVAPERLENALRSVGRFSVDRSGCEALEKGPLRCHRCNAVQSNMPKLQQHIMSCKGRK